MTTSTMEIARERQLDWLLAEVLGEPRDQRALARPTLVPRQWLAAAVAVLAIAVAFAVATLRKGDGKAVAPVQDPPVQDPPVQDPIEQIDWTECHGTAAIDSLPDGVVNLRCFDFDDDAMAKLLRLQQLERLDLSGMDVNAQGYAVSLPISDAGVAHLAALKRLRWLSLASCHSVTGTTLNVLEGVPQLEHLDLTYTGIQSPAIERLQQLPSLRSLSLSHCLDFHGRSLAAIGKIPGLRRLELNGCATVAAADAMHLSQLSELRHLDLRYCMGRFRGQTAMGFDDFGPGGEEPPPPPVQDGIGITDDVVRTLNKLPLETLLLGGCSALTDAIGPTLQQMPRLRQLDLGDLPKTTTALLASIPTGLTGLSLDDNRHYDRSGLRELTRLRSLQELGLNGLEQLTDGALATIVADKPLRVLRVGGTPRMGDAQGPAAAYRPKLTNEVASVLSRLESLEDLEATFAAWLSPAVCESLARLPKLKRVDFRSADIPAGSLSPLGSSKSLRIVSLQSCRSMQLETLRGLAGAQLAELDVYATKLNADDVRELAAGWHGCTVRLPGGQQHRVP